jgi:hypothetical protein
MHELLWVPEVELLAVAAAKGFQEERKHEQRIKQQCKNITNCRAKNSMFIVILNENVYFFPSFSFIIRR